MKEYLIYGLGFFSQALFGSRMVIQWIQSERAGQVVSPSLFWRTSLIASALFLIYGILRNDPVIIFGQLLSYFIYIRNLQLKGEWKTTPAYLRWIFVFLPVAALGWIFRPGNHPGSSLFHPDILLDPMVLLGGVGQLLLNFRFVYQIYHAEKTGVSFLPLGFWVISAVGSVLVVTYGFYRHDPVLLLSQALGLLVYVRNIMLHFKGGAVNPGSK